MFVGSNMVDYKEKNSNLQMKLKRLKTITAEIMTTETMTTNECLLVFMKKMMLTNETRVVHLY